jgi:oxygen-dependent protoporphyrinogen oxidase
MPRIVIVGAGISGLSLAYRLQQLGPGLDITVLEERDRPGGTVWTEQREGYQVEAGANGFPDNKPTTLELCRDLGMAHDLVAASPEAGKNRYLFLDGRLRPLPASLLGFLTSDLLSWRGKVAFFRERFRKPRRNGPDESIADFAIRRAGREAGLFADALVTGIFAGDPAQLSLRACLPRLAALEAEHGSILKGLARAARQRRRQPRAKGDHAPPRGNQMWSLRDGLRALIEALCARLRNPPLLSVPVRALTKQVNGIWTVATEGQENFLADAVILTCPAYKQAAILADLDAELADQVESIPYNRLGVVAVGYRRPDVPHDLAGFGYIAPQRTGRDVLGVQWCSSIFPGRAPDGAVLLRAMVGGWRRPEAAAWDDARLLECVRADLRQALGIRAAPVFHHIVRWHRAIPQYHLGHLQRVARIKERTLNHPGLFLGGNAYHGIALNDCTEQAGILAASVLDYFGNNAQKR